MTDTSTAAVTRLIENVTPGPWSLTDRGAGVITSQHESAVAVACGAGTRTLTEARANAAFIAAARDLVPALLAERDAALAEVARLSTPPDDAEVAELVAVHRGKDDGTVRGGFHRATADALTRLSHALAAEKKLADATGPTRTFVKDKNGREIMLGDRVLHHNVSPHTKPEYWNGVYEVRWEAPSFVLRRVGGGLASDMGFTFRHYPGDLEVITQPAGRNEP